MNQPRCVAMTGIDSYFGRRLVERWRRSEAGIRVVDLDADAERVPDVLQEESVECVVHLGLRDVPGVGRERNPKGEVTATRSLLEGCSKSRVSRLVLLSTTMAYGPRLENPQYLSEDAELHGHSDASWISNRVHIERLIARFRDDHAGCEVTTLRPSWIMGPTYHDAVVRYFDSDWVPTLLGYDPLMQFVHEDDVLALLEASALEAHPGVFNAVGDGVLPLSGYLRLAGKWNIPTPSRWLGFASNSPVPLSSSGGDRAFCDYLKYVWVASGERTAKEFGARTYTSQEAWLAMIGARRMLGYRAQD